MKKVICISGKAQHGKDTTATILKANLEVAGNKVLILHYADLLKYLCREYFNWNGEKDEAGRTLLQHVGTDVVRAKEPDYWVDFAVKFLQLFKDEWDYVIIPDCRFPNEINKMKENFDTLHLRVVRENFISPLSHDQMMHPSELALDDFPYDHLIKNISNIVELSILIIKLIQMLNL